MGAVPLLLSRFFNQSEAQNAFSEIPLVYWLAKDQLIDILKFL